MKNLMLTLAVTLGLGLFTACGDKESSFSILPDSNIFYQNGSNLNSKIDILWVIDNSGSMETSQQNVANNFNSFINGFVTKNLDFKIAVIDTGAWQTQFTNNKNQSRFRDGNSTHSGVFVITPSTPNLVQTFMTNVMLGTSGTGDERMHSSFKQALLNSQNAGFVRPDSHLAIINLTDEDDFSHDTAQSIGHNYNDPSLIPIANYVSWLDQFTGTSGATRRYSVSTVSILDQACETQLNSGQFGGRIIARRVNELVDATGGIKGSLCGDFATSLNAIAANIIELSTQFFLDREPIPESIQVFVDDVLVNPSATNGWTYNPAALSVVFHGSAIPNQGAKIYVKYDPKNIQ